MSKKWLAFGKNGNALETLIVTICNADNAGSGESAAGHDM
jgi:hypothetical protein